MSIAAIAVQPYRRSVFQVAVLMFLTAGFYVFAWSYFTRRTCAAILEQPDQPLWKSIALVVPIFNFFLMFELGKRIQGVAWRADSSRTDASLPFLGMSLFGFTILDRLQGGYSLLGALNFLPIMLMHRAFSRAQISLLGAAGVPGRLHWVEWIVALFGTLYWIDVGLGFAIASPGTFAFDWRGWFVASLLLAAIGLAFAFILSGRTVREGLSAHVNPPAGQIVAASAYVAV